jgi:steroid 5-alpha-reductase/3-oxo-5-alpha-steroid 4-dehydrogenase 1
VTLDQILLYALFGTAAVTFLLLLGFAAPYGRHGRAGFGPGVSPRLGWILMEAPAAATIAVVALRRWPLGIGAVALLALWEAHYLHRALVYPFRLRPSGRSMPLLVIASGAAFNVWNGYLNGITLGGRPALGAAWLTDPRFLVGTALFVIGMAINRHADRVLLQLRGPGEHGYRVPEAGLHRLVASPNYFGELVEWSGWALASWSLAGLAFAVFTAANLIPRALTHRRWYAAQFPDYPADRRAIIPFVL